MVVDREAIWPLCLGTIVALVLHVAMIPAVARALSGQHPAHQVDPKPEPSMKKQPPPPPPGAPPEDDSSVILGRDDAPDRLAMAWIAHDDFQKLQMPQASETEQPALQDRVQPVPDAPPILEAAPASLSAKAIAPVVEDVAAAQNPPQPPAPPLPPDPAVAPKTPLTEASDAQDKPATALPVKSLPADVALDKHDPDQDKLSRVTQRPRADEAEKAAPHKAPPHKATPRTSKSKMATPATMAVKAQPGKPTSAPKSDRQSAATTRIDYRKFVPGYVSVRKGLEVLPTTPKFDIATRLIAIPNNARAIITFDKTGRAVRVRLTRSAGHIGYDSPLLESLYRWRAKGQVLKQIKNTIDVSMDLILR